MKTAYIAGATGCIGLNLSIALKKRGWNVIALHRQSSDTKILRENSVTCKKVDFLNTYELNKEIPDDDCDAFFYLLANTSHSSVDQEKQLQDNLYITKNILDVCSQKNIKKLIYTSTAATNDTNIASVDLDRFKNNYILTKRLSEAEVYKYMSKDCEAVILKPTIVIGKYDYRNYINIFKYLNTRWPKLVIDGVMDFCHINDVVDGHINAYYYGVHGNTYLLYGHTCSWLYFLQQCASIMNVDQPRRKTNKFLVKLIANIGSIIERITNKSVLINNDLVRLFNNTSIISQEEKQKSILHLKYSSTNLTDTLIDYYGWLKEEKLI